MRAARRDRHDDEPLTIEPLDADAVAAQLWAALAASDRYDDAPVSDDYRALRALAHARLQALPTTGADEPPPVDRGALVEDFLASPECGDLASSEDTLASWSASSTCSLRRCLPGPRRAW